MARKTTNEKQQTQNPAQSTIEMMVMRPARIQSEDVTSWVNAVNSAKAGRRTKLYDLYENIMADPFLSDAIEKRVNAITNAEIAFLKNGKSEEALEDLIDTPEFEELIREIILHKAWGKSVIDISFSPEFSVFSVPRKHILIDKMDRPLKERKRYILEKENDMKGYEYENDPYIIECGKDDDLGFMFKAAPYVIYKRGSFGDWAQFAEIFGMPFLVGKYNGYDPKAKERLFEALGQIGSNPRAAIPKETDLDVIPNSSSGSNTLYKDLKDACNEEILIAVLGNTMTTLDGSSRSQSEVHQETQQETAKSDRRYVQRILNQKLLPLLLQRGYPVAGGFFSFPDQGESITTQERLNMALTVKQAGIPVDDDYFYEITGIPKSEKEPGTADSAKGIHSDDPPTKNPDPEPEEKPATSNQQPATKKKSLRNFFANAPVEDGAKITLWQQLKQWFTGRVELADGYSINFNELFNEALKEVYGGDTSPVNKSLFNLSNNAIQNAFTIEFGKEDEDWGQGNAEFIKDFRLNGAYFSGFKAHDTFKEFIGKLYNEDGTQKTFKQFKKDCLDIKQQETRHLKTQYNTAVKSTRAAINYKRYLETEKLYPNLEYLESTAAHQRADHLAYVGTVLPIRHEWWKKHMPPADWNCQCSVRPSNKPVTPVPANAGDDDPVFDDNPGESAKFIVTEETSYYKNTDKKLRKKVKTQAEQLESLRVQEQNEGEEE